VFVFVFIYLRVIFANFHPSCQLLWHWLFIKKNLNTFNKCYSSNSMFSVHYAYMQWSSKGLQMRRLSFSDESEGGVIWSWHTELHLRRKAFRSHHVIDLSSVGLRIPPSSKINCEIHTDVQIDYFCSQQNFWFSCTDLFYYQWLLLFQ
jgi:hypothetical protein